MENAPLTLAYTHARNAAQETKRSNPVAASEEHDLAAAEFAAAAATTTDKEAIRVLKLLEAHHRQLGHILKDAHLKPASASKAQHDASVEAAAAASSEERAKSEETSSTHAQPPRLARTGRGAGRDLSSSIANNLASARGIPSARQKRTLPVSPLVSNEHADAHFTKDSAEPRRASAPNAPLHSPSRPSWAPPHGVHAQAAPNGPPHSPFQQFYSKFESAISTLTAPLAFTSLPLTSPPSSSESKDTKPNPPVSPQKLPPKADPSSSSAVDFSQLISNAALRAVQDNNDPYSKPHESFYLVQTSGGTMSYADITAANYIDRQIARQHRRNTSSTSNDDFVDASSQFLPASAKRAAAGHEKKLHGKTMEELQLENAVLRRTLNETTKRVHGHEFASQQVTAMLAQSVRSLNLSPVTTPENSRGKTVNIAGDPGTELATRMQQKRIDDLEAALEKYNKRLNKRDEENAKLKETLAKYREKWEGLKAGAKARREQAGAADKSRRASGTTTAAMATASTPAKEGTSKPSEEEGAR